MYLLGLTLAQEAEFGNFCKKYSSRLLYNHQSGPEVIIIHFTSKNMQKLLKSFGIALLLLVIASPALARGPMMGGLGRGGHFGGEFGPQQGLGNLTNVNNACVASALSAHFSDLNVFNATQRTQMDAARLTFQNALVAAWQSTEPTARQAAIKAAHEAHRTALRNIQYSLRDDRQQIRQEFQEALKACRTA